MLQVFRLLYICIKAMFTCKMLGKGYNCINRNDRKRKNLASDPNPDKPEKKKTTKVLRGNHARRVRITDTSPKGGKA